MQSWLDLVPASYCDSVVYGISFCRWKDIAALTESLVEYEKLGRSMAVLPVGRTFN